MKLEQKGVNMSYQAVGATLLPIIINIPSSIITRKSIKNWYQVMFDRIDINQILMYLVCELQMSKSCLIPYRILFFSH